MSRQRNQRGRQTRSRLNGRVKRSIRRRLWERNPRCWICDRQFADPDDATIDHVTPLALGGSDHITNLKLACWACNQARGMGELA